VTSDFEVARLRGPGFVLALFASLGWDEPAALRRCDIDLGTRTIQAPRQLIEINGTLSPGPLKSPAGRRIVAFPDLIRPGLTRHLDRFAASDGNSLIFTSPDGQPLLAAQAARRHA
jgi:hypothetical protein